MIIRLVHPGAASRGPLDEAARDYRDRVARVTRVEEVWLKPSRRPDPAMALAEEAERILATLRERDRLVALDRGGRAWTSPEVAKRIDAWSQLGLGALVVAIGSASGLAPTVLERADEKWSFGPLTLPHDLARVVFWEQMYRGFSILRGEPYHK
ncbi:MAG: 23S rRNA (pseudouridine(1915)-N(3))-methyltransferase RlmH [Deltaproteobacteria bacterium]|nr:23S rRNA (pseudouridine(1915)-N(3))-methyltransferase RlmH [Deltaproteobacteria bacterium]